MSVSNDVSIVIPVKNAEENIQKCLEAVFNQTISPIEVIIVDGHSKDKTIDKTKKFNAKILVEDYGTVGGARKIGVESATSHYIAFIDSDCIPKEDWLEKLLNEFDEGIVGIGGGTINIGKGIWQESMSLAMSTFLGGGNAVQDRVLPTKRYVRTISGSNALYRRADLLKVGNYNSNLRINEDTEMNKRLRSIGKILYTPNAIVYHNQNRGLKDFSKRMYVFGRGRALNRLWDVQVIPPILALLTLVFSFVSIKVFILMISLYVCMLIVFDLILFTTHKKLLYLLSVPVVFILEHISYTFGFWNGVTKVFSEGSK